MASDYVGNRGFIRGSEGISTGFQLVGSQFWLFVLCTLIIGAFTFVAGLLQQIPILGLLFSVAWGLWLAPVLWGGYLAVFFSQHDRQEAKVEGIFSMFQRSVDFIVFTLITILFYIPFLVVFFLMLVPFIVKAVSGGPDWEPQPADVTQMLVAMAVALTVMAFTKLFLMWGLVAVADGRGGWEAVKFSLALTRNNFFGSLGVGALCVLLLLVGTALCLVGLLFTLPMIHAILVATYRTAVPYEGAELTEVFE